MSTAQPMSTHSNPNNAAKKTNAPSSYQPRISLWDAVLVSLLVAGIIGSALSVAFQVHATRQQFRVLQKSKQARDQLEVQWGRLLIEQQTFGATTQIGSRAVIYLHMFSPPASQIMTLDLPGRSDNPTSQFSNPGSTVVAAPAESAATPSTAPATTSEGAAP